MRNILVALSALATVASPALAHPHNEVDRPKNYEHQLFTKFII